MPCVISKEKEYGKVINPFKDQKIETLMGVEIANLQLILFKEKNNALEFKQKLLD